VVVNEKEMTFGFVARRARWCPRLLWWLSSSNPLVLVEDLSSADQAVPAMRWGQPVHVAVGPSGAKVGVTYVAHNWSRANKASFTVYPGDDVEYFATWWPWQPGRFTIRHDRANESGH
jgi:hypothetical protein